MKKINKLNILNMTEFLDPNSEQIYRRDKVGMFSNKLDDQGYYCIRDYSLGTTIKIKNPKIPIMPLGRVKADTIDSQESVYKKKIIQFYEPIVVGVEKKGWDLISEILQPNTQTALVVEKMKEQKLISDIQQYDLIPSRTEQERQLYLGQITNIMGSKTKEPLVQKNEEESSTSSLKQTIYEIPQGLLNSAQKIKDIKEELNQVKQDFDKSDFVMNQLRKKITTSKKQKIVEKQQKQEEDRQLKQRQSILKILSRRQTIDSQGDIIKFIKEQEVQDKLEINQNLGQNKPSIKTVIRRQLTGSFSGMTDQETLKFNIEQIKKQELEKTQQVNYKTENSSFKFINKRKFKKSDKKFKKNSFVMDSQMSTLERIDEKELSSDLFNESLTGSSSFSDQNNVLQIPNHHKIKYLTINSQNKTQEVKHQNYKTRVNKIQTTLKTIIRQRPKTQLRSPHNQDLQMKQSPKHQFTLPTVRFFSPSNRITSDLNLQQNIYTSRDKRENRYFKTEKHFYKRELESNRFLEQQAIDQHETQKSDIVNKIKGTIYKFQKSVNQFKFP